MTSAECSSALRNVISAATAKSKTTTSAYPASVVHATRLTRRVSTLLSRRSLMRFSLEPVSHAADSVNRRRPSAEAQFLPEIVHVHVDHVRFRIELVVPYCFGDPRTRHRAARIAHQEFEQRELARREIDDALVLRHAAGQWIERDVAHLQRRVLVS